MLILLSIILGTLILIAVVAVVVVLTWPVTYTYFYQVNLKTLDTFTNDLNDPTSVVYSAFKSKLQSFVSINITQLVYNLVSGVALLSLNLFKHKI